MRQNAARVQLAAQFNERRQEGNAYTYIFRGRKRGFQEAFRRIPRRRFDSERRIPIRLFARWESAMERSTACAVVPDPCCFQRAPCTLSDPQSPAVDIFALADPVRRLTARNIQKIARTRPQADSPATLQKIVPYDSRNLTLTNEVSQTPRDCHGRGLGRGRHAATLSASTSRARCQPVAGLHSQWWAAELSMCGQPSSSLD